MIDLTDWLFHLDLIAHMYSDSCIKQLRRNTQHIEICASCKAYRDSSRTEQGLTYIYSFSSVLVCTEGSFWISNPIKIQIIDEKSLIKKYQNEIRQLKEELEQFKQGIKPVSQLKDISEDDIVLLKQKVCFLTLTPA